MSLCLLSGRDTCCLSRWDKATAGRTARCCRAGRDLTTPTAASQPPRGVKAPLLASVATRATEKTTTAAQKWWVSRRLLPQAGRMCSCVHVFMRSCVHVWAVDKLEGRASRWQQTRHGNEHETQTVVKRGERIRPKQVGFAVKWLLGRLSA